MLPPITSEDERKAQESAETSLFSPSPPERPDAEASATMEDALRNLRLRRFTYEMAPAPSEEQTESMSAADSSETVETSAGAPVEAEESENPPASVSSEASSDNESPIVFTTETPTPETLSANISPDDEKPESFSIDPAEAARTKQLEVASEAAQQTGRLLEQVANGAVEQIRHLLGQIATAAIQQSNRAMVRMAEDAADQTGRVLERMAAEATSQVHQILKKIGDEQITPPLSASVEGLSDEVRRVGRELFKSARAAERNQDLFDTTVAELHRLTSRIEQVPAQLYGAESITEVKAAICREMIGVADAMEASLITSQEVLSQLQESAETGEAEEEAEPASPVALKAPESRNSWQDKLRNWLWRIAPPPTPPTPNNESARIAELEERLRESWDAMNQWLDGQQLLYDRLQTALQAVGIRQIETEGQIFDPTLHRAVLTETRDDVPAGTVIGEERKGYTLDGKILRYAEVIVAKNE